MAQPIEIEKIFPVYKIEQDCLLSKQGDITIAFRLELPELFSLSDKEYEALHQSWVKAIKILPKHCVFHKQDWFIKKEMTADFEQDNLSFLNRSSERFFNERPIPAPYLLCDAYQKAPPAKGSIVYIFIPA
jgi:hypothetical protein